MKASMPKVTGDEDEDLDDSDIDSPPDLDSDINDSHSDSNVSDSEDSDPDDLDLVEDSDADDLIPLNEVPDGLIEYDGSGSESEGQDDEWGGVSDTKKRKRADDKQSRRKKLKSLPTFASYEDYAKLIEDGPEDDI